MLKREKLTKKFLMKLQSGAYVVSNCFIIKGVPVYAGRVTPLYQRGKQWKTIVDLSVNQKLCNVFANRKAAEQWLTKIFHVEK